MYGYYLTPPYRHPATPNSEEGVLVHPPGLAFPGYPTHTAIPNPRAYVPLERPPLVSIPTQPSPTKSHKRPSEQGSSQQGEKRKKTEVEKEGTRWSDSAKSQFYERLLAPNRDETFEKLRKFKSATLKKIGIELFPKKTFHSVTGLWDRSFRVYKNICAFEGVTGGGGDGDEQDVDGKNNDTEEMKMYRKQLARAKRTGKEVGTLKAEEIDKWYSKGWFQLFNNRYHESPNVSRPIPRHSNGDLSEDDKSPTGNGGDSNEDAKLDQLDSNDQDLGIPTQQMQFDDDDNNFQLGANEWPPSPGREILNYDENFGYDSDVPSTKTLATPAAPKSMAKPVPKPAKTPKLDSKTPKSAGASVAAASSELLTKQSGYLDESVAQMKIQLALLREKEMRESTQEDERLVLEQKREQREEEEQKAQRDMDRQRLEREAEQWEYQKKQDEEKQIMEKDKRRFDAAQAILQMPNVSDALKDAANEALLSILCP
ncbi:hypothetical protein BDP27DRAFT_1429370 [Rhodocollybia butyracea]|uniref:Uncharacterized protein n=1 Tax=Rhodocollybia butyracea TaxID=206335 RepID=A0A9P5P9Z8_9AGAR|nr:hypothetical protein BDP27DRAFT_1429370 [Rhodocollybia butyracea]